MTHEEAQLYRELVRQTGGDAVELAAGGDPDPSDARAEIAVEAMIATMMLDDEQEQLYAQLEAMTPGPPGS